MLTISIQLNSRSYGACPWDRAQIEGQIEAIPSPTRILRAILHGAFSIGIGEDDAIKLLLQKLASELPIYYIPQGNYIPLQKYKLDATNADNLYQTGKILSEPYYRYAAGAFFLVGWEKSELSDCEIHLLEKCLQHCYYLGRSEHAASWSILSPDLQHEQEFNCRPDRSGTESVQCVATTAIESLYLSPGLRNAKLKSSNFPGFYQSTYRIERDRRDRSSPSEIIFDTIAIGLNRSLPAANALYWCDLLHKALVKKSPELEIFGNGDLTIAPVYEHDGSFRKILLCCIKGLNDEHLRRVAAIDRLSGRQIVDLYIEDTYLSIEKSNCHWQSTSPFFLPLQPSLKFSRGGRIRQTGYRLLKETEFVRNGATHQAMKFFLRRCEIDEQSVEYGQEGEILLAIFNGRQIASCQARGWIDADRWQTQRFSGTKFDNVAPAIPNGYAISIYSSLSVRGVLSMGYGKNFGLGVMCSSVRPITPIFMRSLVPRASRRQVET
jgi:hypothetical protein